MTSRRRSWNFSEMSPCSAPASMRLIFLAATFQKYSDISCERSTKAKAKEERGEGW
jgi:hypothetical protein